MIPRLSFAPFRRAFTVSALASCACAAAAVSTAVADVIVLQSSAPSLKAGRTLKSVDAISVPSGNSVVLMLPNGATKTVTGPFQGKASAFTKGLSRNAALWDSVKKYVQTGGTTTSSVGATRGFAPPLQPRAADSGSAAAFSWRHIPISASGDVCVARGQSLLLTRERAAGPLKLTLVDFKSAKRTVINFAAGARTAPWPADVEPRAERYALMTPSRDMITIRLRLIAQLPDKDRALQVLHGERCMSQLHMVLRAFNK
ncbi:MAG: hypothetical protein AAGC70_11245 [Pseudomonadota bacterium]